MKIFLYTHKTATKTNFKGVREDRNTVSQLKENNDYSLNEPNQRRINKAIENLAKQRGEENIQFLLNVGENLTYQTNIQNGKQTKNDWRGKLKKATEESLLHSDPILREKYNPEIQRVFKTQPLTKNDIYLSSMKNKVMKKVDDCQEKKEIDRNLDYFITSTETPIEQKKYIMKKLDYFMSPDYDINPQLKDKKTKILSEMVNDITVNTPESKVPNIKAINQKTHGMCAAISIVRKAIAYEDKTKYIDSVLEELNSEDTMKIYDIQNLGKGKKVSVKKAYIDFEYAQSRGYRIVDASTLQWMNIGGMYGAQNESILEFNPFDKNNFDAFHDSFFMKTIADEKIKDKQAYFQALTKAKDEIVRVRSGNIKSEIRENKNRLNYHQNINKAENLNKNIRKSIESVLPKESNDTINAVMSDIIRLEIPTSSDVKKNKESIRKYSFVPNEEKSQKIKKVREYFNDNYAEKLDKAELDKNAETILSSVEEINTISDNLNENLSMPAKISHARRLYEAEGIYRAANLLGFMEDDVQTDYLIYYGIPDRETRILQGFEKVIDRIENKNDEKLIKHYSERFGTSDKDEIVEKLTNVKDSIGILTTVGLDNCYYSIGLGDRRSVLLSEINAIKEDISNGNSKELARSAKVMQIKPNKQKILDEYTKMENAIVNNPDDEEVYANAYNKIGAKNQVNTFIDVFNQFVKNIDEDSPDRDVYITCFCSANGITDMSSAEEINKAISAVGNQFNSISQAIASAEGLLDVRNEDGTPYFTVYAPQLLMKKMENSGELIPAKTMQKLQERFAKIDKLRSSDEFSSRQGKISDPGLYKLSKEESDAIKHIDKKLNRMYKNVTRHLDYQYRDIKEPLQKLANYVGTNSGDYWVQKEGASGLYSPQEVKIFEQITDRPYRAVEDIEEAVKIVKTSSHSGISGSSVFHDRSGGGHAQYVADIKPVGKSGKEALFHDNTWGASEHENQWTDSEGLLRTDYSDHRGGEFGYITDENYRNGNYVDNLLHKKVYVGEDDTESKVYQRMNPSKKHELEYSLMSDMILCGKNPEHKDIAASLKDAVFVPDIYLVEKIGEKVKNMSQAEVKKAILRNREAGKSYHQDYEKIMQRINTDVFHKGIDTKEEYDALPDDDFVKISFEKAALRNSYEESSIVKKLAKAKTMTEIRNIQKEQRNEAYKIFEYSFGKTTENLLYPGLDHSAEMVKSLQEALKRNGVKITGQQIEAVVTNIALITDKDVKDDFTGSLRDTVNISVNKAGNQFDSNIEKSDASQKAKEEWLSEYKNILEKYTYFDKDDLKTEGLKAEGIRNWIDRKFEPKTDEEFVEIYRKLQDMPKDEFKKLTSDIKDSELGINLQSGYDILYKVKASSEKHEDLLRNTLFCDRFYEDVEPAKTQPLYKYYKTEKKLNAARYISRPFDDLYRSVRYDLQMLEYPRMFKANEDSAYRKYGVFPAYPKLDLSNDSVMEQKVENVFDTIENTVESINAQKNAIYDIMLINKMDEYRQTIPADRRLTPMERDNLYIMLDNFVTTNCMDTDFKPSLDAAYRLFDLDKNATIDDWNKELDVIITTGKALENNTSIDEFKKSICDNAKAVNHYFNILTGVNTAPKYRRTLKEEMENILKLENMLRDNGLDFDQESIELQQKIQDNSTDIFSKDQADKFGRLKVMVNKAKKIKSSDKVNVDRLTKQVEDINEYADKYVERFIQPDKRDYIRANMNDWLSKELVPNKERESRDIIKAKLDIAKEKFQKDFYDFHILNHATTILDEYLLLSASDAPQDGDNKKDIYKKYLENALSLSRFIEVQDILMEAEKTGNPAQVKDYFKDYNIEGEAFSGAMDSDVSIDYMVRSLLLDDNTKTAKMLVEKLGLGDRIMKIEKDVMESNNPKKYVDETAEILVKNKEFMDVVKSELDKMVSQLETTDNINKLLNETKINLADKTKEFTKNDKTFEKNVKEYIKVINRSKTFFKNNPNLPKTIIMDQNLNDIYSEQKSEVNESLKDIQTNLQSAMLVYRFLTSLHLPEGSEGEKIQEQMLKDYEDLKTYSARVISGATQGMDVEFVRA